MKTKFKSWLDKTLINLWGESITPRDIIKVAPLALLTLVLLTFLYLMLC